MSRLQKLRELYDSKDTENLGRKDLANLRDELMNTMPNEIQSAHDGKAFIEMLAMFRNALAANQQLNGQNFPALIRSLLSVGEDGLYSNNLRFLFELIQNVDDCDYPSMDDCKLEIHFNDRADIITLEYNEVGFTPFNVFAITGIAEAAKNISSSKNEIGEKGIGFKSVFGVAERVLIRSGWFSFELHKDDFTIPIPAYSSFQYCSGTQLTLYVPGKSIQIYGEIERQYSKLDALFSRNPLLFLNKLTSLSIHYDSWKRIEFHVSRSEPEKNGRFGVERDVDISYMYYNSRNRGNETKEQSIKCTRYSYPVIYSHKACQSRYGEDTEVGRINGKCMTLRIVLPSLKDVFLVGNGALYSYLPTQLRLTVPIACHVPFKLDASREFVDPQNNNLWFKESSRFLYELLKYAYEDWRLTAKENIVSYLPGQRESLFAVNNGKEQCLSTQELFCGKHLLSLKLFYAIDSLYYPSDQVFSFSAEESVKEPQRVNRILNYEKHLFLSPIPVNKFGIAIERDIKFRILQRALSNESITDEALDYLDSQNYEYDKEQLQSIGYFKWSTSQAETIFRHKKLARAFKSYIGDFSSEDDIPEITITNAYGNKLEDVLYEGFRVNDTPEKIQHYLQHCDEKCICLDIPEDLFIPCKNMIVLSRKDPLESFASFCNLIDPKDTFTTRIKLHQASEELNRYAENESCSAQEFLRNLRNIRVNIKEAIGRRGYKNYIDLILKAGTNAERFIHELLQNADDCTYPAHVIPSFSLTLQDGRIVTMYNEVGFNRSDIRAITAIGESTKDEIIAGKTIGEKGIGFKSVFAVASKVRICSGKYDFELSDQEPTIPLTPKTTLKNAVSGTVMEFDLKKDLDLASYDSQKILELCLCLRKLKRITLGTHLLEIEDTDTHRTITIDKIPYTFKRYTHSIYITNQAALRERGSETRNVSPNQSIVCFVPEQNYRSQYPLYTGLPTKHIANIPLVIDAPFTLITSREEIDESSSEWNNLIRHELYQALLSIIDKQREEDREKIFRFIIISNKLHGPDHDYKTETFNNDYLNRYDFLEQLQTISLVPTYDQTVFGFKKPTNPKISIFPAVIHWLLKKAPQTVSGNVDPANVIAVDNKKYEPALRKLGCKEAAFEQVFLILQNQCGQFIRDRDFRTLLYDYLKGVSSINKAQIKMLPIIPVYGKEPNVTEFVRWQKDSIFTKPGANTSESDYIMNENIMSRDAFQLIFDEPINVMDEEYAKHRYNVSLRHIILDRNKTPEQVYKYLIAEMKSGNLKKNDSYIELRGLNTGRSSIPLKNELGQIITAKLFISNKSENYYASEMIQRIIVHRECEALARELGCDELRDVHYEDFGWERELTADEVEYLREEDFRNGEDILKKFYLDGFLSDDLIKKNNLEFIKYTNSNDDDNDYEFPSDQPGDMFLLRKHIDEILMNLVKIISVKEIRTVSKARNPKGEEFSIDSEDARLRTMEIYTPDGSHEKCFCQMCQRLKRYQFIEVNNIMTEPKYYFPELRICLCLECSKVYKAYRQMYHDKFIETIKHRILHGDGQVKIPLNSERTITFTGKHFAEILEILRQYPD